MNLSPLQFPARPPYLLSLLLFLVLAGGTQLRAGDSVVVFNEVHYHPADGDPTPEWVELHNQMAVDVDMGGWRLDGGIQFDFPEGTVLAGGGYLVIASHPSALAAATGFSGALGPFTGALANDGEEIILHNFTLGSGGRRVMDRLAYDDNDPWPVAPDGSGATLAKLDPDTGTSHPGNWSPSHSIGGTPGAVNFPAPDEIPLQVVRVLEADKVWRYNAADADLDAFWPQAPHPVGGDWLEGPAGFGYESRLDSDIRTPLTAPGFSGPFIATHYFETEISVSSDSLARIDHLVVHHLVDDGAIFHLNGVEIFRVNMPAGAAGSETLATGSVEAEWTASAPLPAGALVAGSNRISVEVHQESLGSSDMIFSMKLDMALQPPSDGDSLNALQLNEITAANAATPFAVELKNGGPVPLSLDGVVLSISGDPAREFVLPGGTVLGGGDYLVLDEAMLGDDLAVTDADRIFLLGPDRRRVLDARQASNAPRGRVEDGGEFGGRWLQPDMPTFGAPNSFHLQDAVVINEIFYHAYPDPGTPDTPPTFGDEILLPLDATWRYNQNSSGSGLPGSWPSTSHPVDNLHWFSGPALLGEESSALAEPIRTQLSTSTAQITYYFETEFDYLGDPALASLTLRHMIDDGAVFYLNGAEVARINLGEGPLTPATLASPSVGNAGLLETPLPGAGLLEGTNRLSVEVHQSSAGSSDVVFGAELANRRQLTPFLPGIPWQADPEEWIELHNRSAQAVDLSGWELQEGVRFTFPAGTSIPAGGHLLVAEDAAALAAKYPAAPLAGQYSGNLSNSGERLVLADSAGNPADEAHYYDGGRWPSFADGGGSSLELRDPDADNRQPEAWAASDGSDRSSWQTYTYRGIAGNDGQGNNVFHEFLLGMLDAGELLLDDVSVVEDPDGAAIQFIQNGDFQSDGVGAAPGRWRTVGTHGSHGRTVVVNDPDNPGNRYLHVVATGPTEDKHNKIETTFANGERVQVGTEYEISFRARWLGGSNLVNTRLYFSYLQKTTPLGVPDHWGTPGAANSTAAANLGPTYTGMRHQPVIPDAGEPVTVSITPWDADGIGALTLYYSVNGGAFSSTAMAGAGDGQYRGTIPGRSAGQTVQFYIRGQDSAGAVSDFPAAGPDSRAFYQIDDNQAQLASLHNLRIIMTQADTSFLFLNTNRMSNDRLGATVVYDEKTVFYDVGVRLKGSGFGRYNSGNFGFNIAFDPGHLFRGVHGTLSIERSTPIKEMFAKHLLTRTGDPGFSMYDDVGRLIAPGATGTCLFAMSRHTSNFFEGLFGPDSEDGTLFNHELLYNPNGTTGGPEGLKINNPYNHTGGMYDFRDRGDNREPYRWGFQIRSNRDRDDYTSIIGASKALSLSGQELQDAAEPFIDIDQWTRAFAAMSLVGNDDTYSRLYEHNLRYYARPGDGKLIVLPWDLDRAFNLATNAPLIGGNNVAKLLNLPQNRRLFMGHVLDLVERTFNSGYASPWASHYGAMTGSSAGSFLSWVNSRGSYALSQLPPSIPFAITTNGGAAFSVSASSTVLRGDAWVDVAGIEVNGLPVQVSWTDADTWQITVPLAIGANVLAITGRNHGGENVGGDTITITNTSPVGIATSANTVISEFLYHPSDPTPAEIDAGFLDADLFEFIEITNTSPATGSDFTGVRFADGIAFDFPAGVTLPAGGRFVVVANPAAFVFRYGASAATIAGAYDGNLSNGGETILLQAADTTPIASFTYGDSLPWPDSADGSGDSLVLSSGGAPDNPLDWRPSTSPGGNPGASDSVSFGGAVDDLIPYALAGPPAVEIAGDSFILTFDQYLAADDARTLVEYSADMVTWTTANAATDLISRINRGDGTATLAYRGPLPPSAAPSQFARVRVQLR